MAVRLAILAHHYRQDWDWTAEGLAAAAARLGRWRDAVQAASGVGPDAPLAHGVLAGVREHMAHDLDAPAALAVVDEWASGVLSGAPGPQGGELVRDTVDALLGIVL